MAPKPKPTGAQPASQRTLDQLAQANSYTYTLQQPMSAHQRLNSKRNQTTPGMDSSSKDDDEGEGESEEDESEESKLSDYSPNEEVKGFFHKPQKQQVHPGAYGVGLMINENTSQGDDEISGEEEDEDEEEEESEQMSPQQ